MKEENISFTFTNRGYLIVEDGKIVDIVLGTREEAEEFCGHNNKLLGSALSISGHSLACYEKDNEETKKGSYTPPR